MKYKLLRFSLLSMLVMLFGGFSLAAILEDSDEKTATIDLADFDNADKSYTVSKAGTSSTGGEMEIITTDVIVSSSLGYAKKSEMSIYKTGSMTIAFNQGISAHLTKVEITLSNSYPFSEPAGWTTSYTANGESVTASTTAKVADKTVQTFTTDATNVKSLTLTNASNGKTGIRKIVVTYVKDANGGDEPTTSFRDIKLNLMEHSELLTESPVFITVAEDGTIGTTESADEAAATIKGKVHGSYGSSNFTASVPVQGCVKITYATHDYGNDIVVTNDAGAEVAKFNTSGSKWMNDHNNVVVAYYRINEPTTLHFSNANYNPYFAVEAIDPADIPAEITKYNITFAAGEGTGVAPKALEVNAGDKFNAPKNYTLYKEGATLTGWNDGTTTYATGAEITPEADMTLTAIYTTNEVSLADRTNAVTLTYPLDGYNDNPKHNIQGSNGIIVTQATVNGKTIDVKADVDATSGKFAHNGSGWHQVNTGTKITVPSCKDATFAVSTYNDATSVNFNGEAGTADGNTAKFTATTDDATLEISQVSNNYWNSLTITLPATSSEPAAGTADNPYTVAQARAAIDAGTGITGVYAKGIVSKIVTAYNAQYGNITYNISEDGTTTADQLQAYRGKGINGENFTSEDDIQVGDQVVIYGNLKKYNTTYEFDTDNQLVSLTREEDPRAKTFVSIEGMDEGATGEVGGTMNLPTATVRDVTGAPLNDATVEWTSSNENVATIADGVINFVGKGTSTITASYAGDNTYQPSKASFELTVTKPAVIEDGVFDFDMELDYGSGVEKSSVKNQESTWTAGNVTMKLAGRNCWNDFSTGQGTKGQIRLYAASTNDPAGTLTLSVPEDKVITKIVFTGASLDNMGTETGEYSGGTWTGSANSVTFTATARADIYTITVTYGDEGSQPSGFRDIKADLTQLQELATGSEVYIKVADDGAISQADNAEEAAATLKGNWHGTAYGWSNFTASVPVQGCVKITYATHDYGNDIVVTNDAGAEVAKFNTSGSKWMNDHNNVVVAYYRINEPTTLHFSNANYNPYFAVEAIDPADIPAEITKYNITFAAGEGTGVAPKALEVNAGDKFNAPKNYTLYKEGATLTGWNDGTTTYATGAEITPEADMTLTAIYTTNEVSLADRTNAVTLTYPLDGYNDNPKHNIQGSNGIIVTQATVNGKTIDVKADVDATSGKFAHNGSGWHQVNTGTKITVPSCKDATFAVSTYNDATSVNFNGEAGTADGNTANFTATTDDATLEISQVSNNYWNNLTITLPATSEPQPHDPVVMIWDYSNAAPTENPDNGLYYGASVNDPAGTNNGMKGIKLNSEGWAYFEKPAVAGKLTLTFGNRKNSDAYEVNVSRGTLGEGNKGIKGDLIGYVTINESPGSATIELDETVTGIYIDRKTGSEGVLQKIVFKENIARTFKDFEIPYATLTAEGYTGADLPEGVTFSGTFHDQQHGYSNATLVVPVDGTVKFTISGCQYANPQTFDVKNSLGETVATLDQKSAGCFDNNGKGIITYFYTDYPTTLTFSNISYLSYFKAEAAEVEEVTVTYKDQNGIELGKKTVFAGDPLGEVPYTEADLTIAEGEKFRGWVYSSGIKVKPTDIVNDNITVKASVTPIETDPTVGSIQTYDLTQATFYPEDHENFNVTDGAYYNNHGFTFAAGGSFDVKVAGKAQIVLTLCQYGNGTTISVTDAKGNVIKDDVPAIAEADGGTTTVVYDGEATTLTFTFAAQTYLHKVVVFNVENFLAKDEQSGYYIVPAGDAASLIMALNAAASENGAKIFLPNGTYDLGETTLTSISGNNISIIGQSMEDVIIKNAPPTSMEGLGKADLFNNTSTGLYMQDLTLQNGLDYYAAGSAGRAPTLHDQGTKTINKNVRHLSYQDTYYSHKVGGLYYFEGGEIHGTVDYLCGNGKVYFNEVTLVNEKRSTATIVANSELYVFNNCVVENNADKYNLGRAWSDNPVCIYLNTTLKDPERLLNTRWNLSGINCDFSKAGEYGTKNSAGEDITPESNVITFTKQSTTMNTILTAEEAATYTMQYVLGDWATEAQNQTKQVDAPAAEMKNGTISWSAADGATAYAIFKNGVLLGITTEESFTPEAITEIVSSRAESSDEYTIRAANSRGGFGEPQKITVVTGINAVNAAQENADAIYNIQGVRVQKAQKGVYIVNGRKVVIK